MSKRATPRSRFLEIDLTTLIPQSLKESPQVRGSISMVTKATRTSVRYMFTDEARVSLARVEAVCKNIELSMLGTSDKGECCRPLLWGNLDLSQDGRAPSILYHTDCELYPGFNGKQIRNDFRENLATAARSAEYRFITGYEEESSYARSVLKGENTYLVRELKPRYQAMFSTIIDEANSNEKLDSSFVFVQFLDSMDVAKYVSPARVNVSSRRQVGAQLNNIAKGDDLYCLMRILREMLGRGKKRLVRAGDRATLAEVLEELNNVLPQKDRYVLSSPLDQDDLPNLEKLVGHMHDKLLVLFHHITEKKLEEISSLATEIAKPIPRSKQIED